jgi:hypothetical protein
MTTLIRSNQLMTAPGIAGGLAVNQPINTNVQPATRPAQPCDGDWEDYDGPATIHPSSLATNAGIIQPVSGNLVWEDYETGEPDRAELELAVNQITGGRIDTKKLDTGKLLGLLRMVTPADLPGDWEDLT